MTSDSLRAGINTVISSSAESPLTPAIESKTCRLDQGRQGSITRFFPDSAGKKWFACWRTASSGIYRFMSTPDDFSTYVADLLSGTYDCVDRISVRGYFPLGQTSGGLLTWWNQLFPNTELSEQRLRKLAGDFARRVHAYARKHKIPLRYFAIGDKTKHAQAEKLRPADPKFRGVFAIFVAKAPAIFPQLFRCGKVEKFDCVI